MHGKENMMFNSELEMNIQNAKKNENKDKNIKENKKPEAEQEKKINDYESHNVIASEKYLIAKELTDLIAGVESKINILNLDGSINEVSTKLVNEIFKKNNIIETIKNAFILSLIEGEATLRIAGDAFNPLLYLCDSSVLTWDKSNENNIKKLWVMIQLNNGAEKTEIVYESYNKFSKQLWSTKDGLTKITKIEAMSELPFVMFAPHKDYKTNSYKPYMGIVNNRFEFLNANYNKLMVYAENVNYHLLPDKANLIESNADPLWKNKVKNLFIFRKNNISTKPNYKEVIEKIEPNMDYYQKIFATMGDAINWVAEGVGVVNTSITGTKQMSEQEIAVIKQKEKMTIAVFRNYIEAKMKLIIKKWIDIDVFDLEIIPLTLPTKNEIDKEKMELENGKN